MREEKSFTQWWILFILLLLRWISSSFSIRLFFLHFENFYLVALSLLKIKVWSNKNRYLNNNCQKWSNSHKHANEKICISAMAMKNAYFIILKSGNLQSHACMQIYGFKFEEWIIDVAEKIEQILRRSLSNWIYRIVIKLDVCI